MPSSAFFGWSFISIVNLISALATPRKFCKHFIFDYVALTLFDWPSQTIRLTKLTDLAVHNPAHIATYGLASSDFARHYFRNLG